MKQVLFISTTLTTVGLVSAQTPNAACAPGGAHIQTGSVACHCNADQSVTCDAFNICGVRNTNANVDLVSTFTATVQCRNHDGQIVDVKSQPISDTVPVHNLRTKERLPECTVGVDQSADSVRFHEPGYMSER
ncbi:hypothetical protein VB005_03394 [Metarhizium brunneum]